MAILPPKPIHRAERRAAGCTTGTASAATTAQVHDLTDSDEQTNTFTFVHRRDHVMGPHDDELRALQAELDQLKGNIVVLSNVPGPHVVIHTWISLTVDKWKSLSRLAVFSKCSLRTS